MGLGAHEGAASLSETQREVVQERLPLARDFMGVQDPTEFFLPWKTPTERHVPLAQRTAEETLRSRLWRTAPKRFPPNLLCAVVLS